MTGSDSKGSNELFFRKDDKSRRSRKINLRPKQDRRVVRAEPINQELYKRNAELAVRNKTLALLRQLDDISLSTSSTTDVASGMTAAIAIALGYDVVSIAMVNEKENVLQWKSLSSSVPWITKVITKIDIKRLRASMSNGLASVTALAGKKEHYIDDPGQVYPQNFVQALREADQSPDIEEVKHSILYPLQFGREILGLLTLSSSRSLKDLSRYEQDAVNGITGLVALAMYKAELYEDLQIATEKLEDANKQLTELDKEKSEFMSIASHQLYTPLTALRGYISMLQEGDFGDISKKQKPIMNILNASAEKLIGLIKNLLDISRIESGRLELNLKSLDVGKMVDDLVKTLYPNAVAKKLNLNFNKVEDNLPHVVADEQRLRQVMLNFIDNAIKYTDQGTVDVQLKSDADNVIFSVTDTGKGIASKEINRLFHKFSRVGGASRFHTEGTGLGLYVAQKIVKEHNGEVQVSSSGVGHGSTFGMTLPAEGSEKSLKVGQRSIDISSAETDEAYKSSIKS